MHVSDRLIYTLFVLTSFTVLGMLLSSWRIIIYSHLLIVGLSVFIGMWRTIQRMPQRILIPILVSVVFLVLFGAVDIIWHTIGTDIEPLILGLSAPMAIVLAGILPVTVIACLIYALTFPKEEQLDEEKIGGAK